MDKYTIPDNPEERPSLYTTIKDLHEFIVYYERRHSDLEQRLTIQSTEQNLKYDAIQRDMTAMREGLEEVKSILKNGLISQVADLVRQRDRSERRREDLWIPFVRDWVRVVSVVILVYAIENAHIFLSALGVK